MVHRGQGIALSYLSIRKARDNLKLTTTRGYCLLSRSRQGAVASPKTHNAPPSGTSGYSPGKTRLRSACIPRESPPHPASTAMYCLPSIEKDAGGARIPVLIGNSQSSLPVDASKACIRRSLVPPLNTNPPAVASIAPQFGELGIIVRPNLLASVDVPGLHLADVVGAGGD